MIAPHFGKFDGENLDQLIRIMAADHHFWKLRENRQFFHPDKTVILIILLWNWGYPMFKPTHLPSIFRRDEEWKPSLPEECVQRSNSHGADPHSADAHSRSGSRSGSRSNSRNDTPRDAEMKAGHHYASLWVSLHPPF